MKKKKWTKEQKEQLKIFWRSQQETTDRYRENIHAIEKAMEDALGIKGSEFFWADDGIVGIGTAGRDYELLQWCDGELKAEDEIDARKENDNED